MFSPHVVPDAVERLSPSVVSLRSEFRRGARGPSAGLASGTGLAVHAAGYVVTNRHVVAGADRVRATWSDDSESEGRVVGADAATDIALLHFPDRRLVPAPLGDSDRLRTGEPVVAIGHSLALPGGPTVSLGVVSARHRPLPGSDWVAEGLLQTDAAVNPGNSGGPLATLAPEVIGINTAMVPSAQGVGFAVPINTVRMVYHDLVDFGRVIRPWIGVVASPSVRGRTEGIELREVLPGGPAHAAGLRAGDFLLDVAGAPVPTLRALLLALRSGRLGSRVRARYLRHGSEGATEVELREAPLAPS